MDEPADFDRGTGRRLDAVGARNAAKFSAEKMSDHTC